VGPRKAGEGRVACELEAAVGPAEARGAAAPHARHTGSGTHGRYGPSVRSKTVTSLLSLNSKLDLPSLQKFHKILC
jgi:hypothetical protein